MKICPFFLPQNFPPFDKLARKMGCSSSKDAKTAAQPFDPLPLSETFRQISRTTSFNNSLNTTNYANFQAFFSEAQEPQIFEYHFIKNLGHGSHATVYLAENTETNEKFAAKVYCKTVLYKNTIMDVEPMIMKVTREIEIMAGFKHPNIMSLKEVLDDDHTNSVIFIIPFADKGSLLPQDTSTEPIEEKRAQFIFAQIAEAVKTLHEERVAHRDIKPENIMMFGNEKAVLADFSSAKVIDGESDLVEDSDGTPAFYSPEECLGKPFHAFPADIWALGVSLYLMIFGHLPFFDIKSDGYYLTQLYTISQQIIHNDLIFDPEIKISKELENFFIRILEKDPEKRYKITDVLNDPWVVGANYTVVFDETTTARSNNLVDDIMKQGREVTEITDEDESFSSSSPKL